MNKATLMEKYPHLYTTLLVLGLDNELEFLEDGILPDTDLNPSILEELEKQASSLNQEEKELMAAGEMSERESFIAFHGVQNLDHFLESTFNDEVLVFDFRR